MLQSCSTMKTATVRDLRNRYLELLGWIASGEEIVITRRGKPIARLVPEQQEAPDRVDWSQSPAVLRNRTEVPSMTAEQSLKTVHDASGQW